MIRELSKQETKAVNGGFFIAPLVALTALVLSGCATMPNKGHQDNQY